VLLQRVLQFHNERTAAFHGELSLQFVLRRELLSTRMPEITPKNEHRGREQPYAAPDDNLRRLPLGKVQIVNVADPYDVYRRGGVQSDVQRCQAPERQAKPEQRRKAGQSKANRLEQKTRNAARRRAKRRAAVAIAVRVFERGGGVLGSSAVLADEFFHRSCSRSDE